METKRQNFDVTPEQAGQIQQLRETLGAASTKDAILRAVRLALHLAEIARRGDRVFVGRVASNVSRVVLPDLEPVPTSPWTYLVARPHEWRKQRFVKGRRLLAATVWRDMLANQRSGPETAVEWDLPIEAVDEIVAYCEENEPLIRAEALEEQRRLRTAGVPLAPPD
ncbi:hypothetical protein ACFL59_02930 [Planctomycetota bacterium]